ncbi:peptidylprolyl isomerase [Limosilactobacillus mucosae]|uniref:Peptidyl-prolyl cis-trans isomerase n=4 Tax=Bacteria TaxID=2 RepID=A0AAJ1HUP7_LIMMU|nr:peptidylprolyl isomerase [Limosilactobacillus mucosae]MDC2828825.1 peptidylprolyl isomerase [Limosilactobacillus mucosae]MDC2836679.1 peptidylprolyl isomerase [Limosilactobacillus mucosae]MDC2848859.1 peptidylprolyl isomerase [Limosilactobacillus mucosae]MDC2854411.1 peptidylprolyl isomerase [Limosilactobacillus mucosae]MDE8676781.1 peptidylprolyl isomerase [Limosilactobacillus mucosae]
MSSVYPQLQIEDEKGTIVTLHTDKGDITAKLFDDLAPKTVKNFIELAKKDYYNNLSFFRVIPNMMIETGDPTGTGSGGESIYGGSFEDEYNKWVFNFNGALSMANQGVDSNRSAFFIVTSRTVNSEDAKSMKGAGYPDEVIEHYEKVGGSPWFDQRHTVFGQVMSGMDVAQEIAAVRRDLNDRPLEDVLLKSIEIKAQ